MIPVISKTFRAVALELKNITESVLVSPLRGRLGRAIRSAFWKTQMKTIGAGTVIGRNAIFGSPELIHIGSRSSIGEDCAISAAESRGVWIGSDVNIARGTYFHASNHKFDDLTIPMSMQGTEAKVISFLGREYSIVVEDDTWIGSNVVITSGTHLGTGSVVAAGSVVSGVIPPRSVVVGNPARVMFNRAKRLVK